MLLLFRYADDFIPWVVAIASSTNPPLVHSISYGEDEFRVDDDTIEQFDNELMKFGLMGITVLAASGDDGANSRDVRDEGARWCGYQPSWPASSPWVTAVGATQGPESDDDEVACSSSAGGEITSGGGFSSKYPAPSYQTGLATSYLSSVSEQPEAGYNVKGRGLPDVSVAGNNFDIVVGGFHYAASGTSAATPVVAAMISLINAYRIKLGLPSVGFINPALYRSLGSFANDITEGHNKCSAVRSRCCKQGFYTAPGWDPVTGFGSVDFRRLKKLFLPSSSE